MISWRMSAGERGRVMALLGRYIRVGGFAAATVLVIGPPVTADDNFPGPRSTTSRLTAQSSWSEILKTREVQAEFPQVTFGKAYVPLQAVCVEGTMLRIADPRIDDGVRVSAEHILVQGPARAAMSSYAAARSDPFTVGPVALSDQHREEALEQSQHAPVGYLLNVYQVNSWVTSTHAPLFQKVWEIPTCRSK